MRIRAMKYLQDSLEEIIVVDVLSIGSDTILVSNNVDARVHVLGSCRSTVGLEFLGPM